MKNQATEMIVGEKINRCTFIKELPKNPSIVSRAKRGLFKCDCGKEFESQMAVIKSGKVMSCGCYAKEVNSIKNTIVYTAGELIGRLIFIKDTGIVSGGRSALFMCSCGKEFETRIQHVKKGLTKSCGCLTSKLLSEAGKLRDNSHNKKPQNVEQFLLLPDFTEADKHRFWSKVGFTANPDTCWNWNGSKRRKGYGRFSFTKDKRDVSLIATRVSYFLSNNEQPLDKCVLHKCDNPHCVNPKHLFLGTNKDNTIDMMNKGRHNNQYTISNL